MSTLVWNGQQVIDQVHERIRAQMIRIGQDVVEIAKRYAPIDTGYLRDSIAYAYNDATYTVAFLVGAPYGIFVEYGTRYQGPHPYLRPAINTIESIYGIHIAMAFLNTPHINQPIEAHGARFKLPSTLTAGQRRHVKYNLTPVSKMHFTKNVSRATLYVRQQPQQLQMPGMRLPTHYRPRRRRHP